MCHLGLHGTDVMSNCRKHSILALTELKVAPCNKNRKFNKLKHFHMHKNKVKTCLFILEIKETNIII